MIALLFKFVVATDWVATDTDYDDYFDGNKLFDDKYWAGDVDVDVVDSVNDVNDQV